MQGWVGVPGLLSELGGLSGGIRRGRVCVAIARKHLSSQIVLYELQRPEREGEARGSCLGSRDPHTHFPEAV